MKTITKIIHINDGNELVAQNGDRLFVETSPRAEAIISAFLTDGWTLHSRVSRFEPSVTNPGNLTFYISGWDFLFIKEIPDDAADTSDSLLSDAITEALRIKKEEDTPDEDDNDDLEDFDMSEDDFEDWEDEDVEDEEDE